MATRLAPSSEEAERSCGPPCRAVGSRVAPSLRVAEISDQLIQRSNFEVWNGIAVQRNVVTSIQPYGGESCCLCANNIGRQAVAEMPDVARIRV
jgi:hypothetical protein